MATSIQLTPDTEQQLDFLVTWNCRHLANANKFGHIRRVNTMLGLLVPALERFTLSCSRASPRSSGKTGAGTKRPGRGWGGLPAWEGGHPGRHAGWKPAFLKEERETRYTAS